MNELKPINQKKLFGLQGKFLDLIRLYNSNTYPNKLLLSGPKGLGKSTLAYHFINYVLSISEKYKYNLDNFEINEENSSFKTILNSSNTNLITIDIISGKKSIDISQIRDLISNLNKSSFNNKPRFILIDNIELLNINSTNALLKVLEEPNQNVFFILINNNKKILPTLLSRCINYKINLTNKETLDISSLLLGDKLDNLINKDLLNYYFTPGTIYHLVKFSQQYKYDLKNLNLKEFLKILIKENNYKKDPFMNYMIYHLIEFYFTKLNQSFSKKINEKYTYFLQRIFDTKTFNLDEEVLLLEFKNDILNG
tara:strand:- start:753 stop:1685 length:933 start_codon:yes stop_codon:yes gene_type:complete